MGGLGLQLHQYDSSSDIFNEFRINCEKCRGLCCVALYFSKFDGFPSDKVSGTPCHNLDSDFCCSIHSELYSKQMKGCLAYDCFGAGQIVASLYEPGDWRSNSQIAQEIFEVFIKVFHLQQILWYLSEILTLMPAKTLWKKTSIYIDELHILIQSSPKDILNFDIEELRTKVNPLLKEAGELVKREVCHTNREIKKKDFIGHNFKKSKLDGYNFSSALLIAANLESCSLTGSNFIGADLRDTNIKNADLRESIFLTQGQINAAKGNKNTRIPKHLIRPLSWM
ncbi:pentapeptide repeat-containing protein [Kineothrix alysoides]|uniref:pentapeptide repeat-containing protein n=1 Tax=Kineothrix alysoides TaxID=1469948 RepID=UPI001FA97377|nr:pentapeptide repeat-containing protein [Kineothrix alysoides]